MGNETGAPLNSKGMLWTGRVLSGIVIAFMAMDTVFKFMRPVPPQVSEAFTHLGLPLSLGNTLGVLIVICTVLYAIPKTTVFGAILLTGYWGGAVLTHLRVGDPLFSHILFPTYLGVLAWLGIWLREPRLRAVLPLRS